MKKLNQQDPSIDFIDLESNLGTVNKLITPSLSDDTKFIEPTKLAGENFLKLDFIGINDKDLFKNEPIENQCPPDNSATKDVQIKSTIALVEVYKVSSFLGTSGPGQLLNTLTLLPGEESTITIRTFSRTASKTNDSTSIIDSYSTETENRFNQERKNEETNTTARQENETASAKAGGNAIWGWGTASASGSWSRDTHTQRTNFTHQFTKTITNHTQKASSSRNIQIGTSTEVKNEEEKYESIERKLKNVNLGKTLDYKFHQLNQEYHTILHVTDLKIAYMKKFKEKELILEYYTLEDLDLLLEKRINDKYHTELKKRIKVMLQVMAHDGDLVLESDPDLCKSPCEDKQKLNLKQQCVYKTVSVDEKGNESETNCSPDDALYDPVKSFWRFNKEKYTKFQYPTDDVPQICACVPGYVVGFMTQILRTDGIRIEPRLGVTDALDDYGKNVQNAEVSGLQLDNQLKLSLINREENANQILQKAMEEGYNVGQLAHLYHLLYNCIEDDHGPFS
ncbi:TPA: hypothetical protein QCZ12_005340 [Bacillus cereus]|nr:hypothetical protein [Bacillus cereus]